MGCVGVTVAVDGEPGFDDVRVGVNAEGRAGVGGTVGWGGALSWHDAEDAGRDHGGEKAQQKVALSEADAVKFSVLPSSYTFPPEAVIASDVGARLLTVMLVVAGALVPESSSLTVRLTFETSSAVPLPGETPSSV